MGDAVRRRPGQAVGRRRHDRPRPDRIDADTCLRRAARQRHRRHRQLPQARPQPAAHRHVPGDRAGRRRRPHRVHRPCRRALWPIVSSSVTPARSDPDGFVRELDDVLTLQTEGLAPLRSPVMLVALHGLVRHGRRRRNASPRLIDRRYGHGRRDRPRPVLRLHPGASARLDRRRRAASVRWPGNEFHVVRADGAHDLVVLVVGVEPHLLWATYATCVIAVSRRSGARPSSPSDRRPRRCPHTRSRR